MTDFSCLDWFEKLKAGRSPLPDALPLDHEEARLAVETFNKLRLPDVPGQPLLRDVAGQWARDFVSAIFGLVEMNDDRTMIVNRKARKFFQLVPKKNSKTTNGAAIMMTAMIRNRRPNAEFLLVGPTQATAERAYEQAEGMVKADPWLSKRFHLREHLKTIEDRKNGAKLRIRSFDNKVMTGAKPVGVLVDELHELGKISYAAKVMTQIEGGIVANAEGFVIIITTQSDEPPTGIFKDELKLARSIRDGEFKDAETLPMLYEFPTAMQADKAQPWTDPTNWNIVLPNIGKSITAERLLPKFREAREAGIDKLSIWASQHLNIEVGVGIGSDGWSGAPYWTSCVDKSLASLNELLARSEVCTIGIDWGGADDLAALYVIGRERKTKRWLGWGKAWARKSVFERRKGIVSSLEQFEADGDLVVAADGEEQAMSAAAICRRVADSGLLPEQAGIGLDSAGVALLLDALEAEELTQPLVQAVAQGWKLQTAVSSVPLKLEDRRFLHGDQALMAWAVGNAKQTLRGSNYVVTKEVSGAAKIDPLMALFNAAMLMFQNPEAKGAFDADAWIASYA
ncbi:terminase large subunit [Tianweitania sediminis]|uniref:Terminase large subunit n=1 Tax=Tianweitania sediminis TaxID=1502156 RepID=A0A8J7RHA1_9HYPH|nr:terminase large subunit [Tianweitania sediminis]MBP0438431.1 terminase large subunit [Tianweitania sediminis]